MTMFFAFTATRPMHVRRHRLSPNLHCHIPHDLRNILRVGRVVSVPSFLYAGFIDGWHKQRILSDETTISMQKGKEQSKVMTIFLSAYSRPHLSPPTDCTVYMLRKSGYRMNIHSPSSRSHPLQGGLAQHAYDLSGNPSATRCTCG